MTNDLDSKDYNSILSYMYGFIKKDIKENTTQKVPGATLQP